MHNQNDKMRSLFPFLCFESLALTQAPPNCVVPLGPHYPSLTALSWAHAIPLSLRYHGPMLSLSHYTVMGPCCHVATSSSWAPRCQIIICSSDFREYLFPKCRLCVSSPTLLTELTLKKKNWPKLILPTSCC